MPTIVLVEDASLQRELIRYFLYDTCSIVGAVDTGTAAIDAVEQHSPDIVIMDIGLPDSNGIELTEIILDRSPETDVIVSTARAGDEYERLAEDAGAVAVLTKPYSQENLLAAIERVRE